MTKSDVWLRAACHTTGWLHAAHGWSDTPEFQKAAATAADAILALAEERFGPLPDNEPVPGPPPTPPPPPELAEVVAFLTAWLPHMKTLPPDKPFWAGFAQTPADVRRWHDALAARLRG